MRIEVAAGVAELIKQGGGKFFRVIHSSRPFAVKIGRKRYNNLREGSRFEHETKIAEFIADNKANTDDALDAEVEISEEPILGETRNTPMNSCAAHGYVGRVVATVNDQAYAVTYNNTRNGKRRWRFWAQLITDTAGDGQIWIYQGAIHQDNLIWVLSEACPVFNQDVDGTIRMMYRSGSGTVTWTGGATFHD